MTKILICGYYGAYNRGDDLILKVLTDYLKTKNVDISVTSLDPDSTSKEYGVKAIQSYNSLRKGFGKFIKEVLQSDVFILGGGGLYQDYGKHFRVVLFYGLRVLVAGLLRKKIAYFALGVGNIELKRSKQLIYFVTRYVNVITVRDEGSKKVLADIGVNREILVCADPVFSMTINNLSSIAHKNKPRMRVGISVLPYDQQLQLSNGTDENIENSIINFTRSLLIDGYEVVFIPMEKNTDDNFINKLLANGSLTDVVTVFDSSQNHDVFIADFASFDIVVAMRLHAIILSATLGIPFLAISYHSKVSNTVSLLDQQDIMIDLDKLSSDKLKANFKVLVMSYNERKNCILSKTAALKQETTRLFCSLDSLL